MIEYRLLFYSVALATILGCYAITSIAFLWIAVPILTTLAVLPFAQFLLWIVVAGWLSIKAGDFIGRFYVAPSS